MTTIGEQMKIPSEMAEGRRRVSERYLHGAGIEIGALYAALPLGPSAKAAYVDRMTVADLRDQYPELRDELLIEPDIIDDGEVLGTLPDGTLDFIAANHVMEHLENPIGTLRNHLAKLRAGGTIYYSIPDQRFGFDVYRPITAFSHLIQDERDGGESSRRGHYTEWASCVVGLQDPALIEENVRLNMENKYSIHFHVWDLSAWIATLCDARDFLQRSFEIVHVEQNYNEVISILRKPT